MIIAYIQNNSGGEEYALHDDFSISRPKINMGPSGQWKATGLYSNRGTFVEPIARTIERLRAGELRMASDWLYKNGKPRFYLGDLDHGTRRIQGAGIRWIVLTHRTDSPNA